MSSKSGASLPPLDFRLGGKSSGGDRGGVGLVRDVLEYNLQGQKVNIPTFDRKFFQTVFHIIPYEQIETYQHLIRLIDAKNKNDLLDDYLSMGNDLRGGNLTLTIHLDEGNLDDVLHVIDVLKVVLEGSVLLLLMEPTVSP